MNPNEIRSDLIGAWILREWLVANLPDLAADWPLEVSEPLKGFTQRVKALFPPIEYVFVGQSPIARTAIERWNLTQVAYLGAGTPTPFSPRPDQLLYYTDANPGVIAEAQRAGYNALQVDVRNPNDLTQLKGVSTLIATGLVHFLPDPGVTGVFAMLARAGFRRLIFNHSRGFNERDEAAPIEWGKLGFQLYSREPDQLALLLPPPWKFTEVIPVTEFYRGHPQLERFFVNAFNFYNIYVTEIV